MLGNCRFTQPLICHDAIDMHWSTLGEQCINDGKLLACLYYRNSVGVWVVDVSVLSDQDQTAP